MSKEKALIIFTVAIDVIGLGIIIPVLPTYVESFGLTAFTVGLMFSVYSLFSFLSAPFLGTLSDRIGRRPVLLISIASTSVGWFIFALAKGLPFLLLGRIIDGLAAGNISTAQSLMADISKDPKERAGNLGIIGMIFGLGFIVGPFIGGVLSKISPTVPFFFVAVMALINVVLAYFFLPETNKHIVPDKVISWNPVKPLVAAIKNQKLRVLYLVWFMFMTTAVSSNTVFALYMGKVYGYSPFQTGLFFTIIGVVLALNQGVLLRKFWLQKFKQRQLILLMIGFFAVGFLLMIVPTIAIFIVGMIMTAFGQSTLNVAMTNEIVEEADVKQRGEAVGVLTAITSAGTILAPLLSTSVFEFNPRLPYIIASVLSIIAFAIMYQVRMINVSAETTEELAV